MKLKGPTIFLLMQVFFVIFGFALYYGLKELKLSLQAERAPAEMQKTATQEPR